MGIKIGDWQIDAFVAGSFRLDGGAMFGVVPKTMWSKVAPADTDNRIAMVMRPLLLRNRDRVVLVDAGCGVGYDEKLTKIYGFESNVPMEECLEPFSLAPDDVTDVIITHFHFDHGGGVAYPQGERWLLTFPNATHYVQERQWRHALNPNPRDRASFFRERIEILEREKTISRRDGEWSFAPGIDLLVFDGHTPGQQLPKITGGGETLFYCGDLIPTAAHLPTPFVMSYDLQPVLSMTEKASLLETAARESWALVFEHDPAVVACRVNAVDGRFSRGESVVI
jgi:glyoxylase-like metal-dependent hydrolase (beta-lactamase superfamily II)